jgi:hypothetical protein
LHCTPAHSSKASAMLARLLARAAPRRHAVVSIGVPRDAHEAAAPHQSPEPRYGGKRLRCPPRQPRRPRPSKPAARSGRQERVPPVEVFGHG